MPPEDGAATVALHEDAGDATGVVSSHVKTGTPSSSPRVVEMGDEGADRGGMRIVPDDGVEGAEAPDGTSLTGAFREPLPLRLVADFLVAPVFLRGFRGLFATGGS